MARDLFARLGTVVKSVSKTGKSSKKEKKADKAVASEDAPDLFQESELAGPSDRIDQLPIAKVLRE